MLPLDVQGSVYTKVSYKYFSYVYDDVKSLGRTSLDQAFFYFFVFLPFYWATPVAYGGSQARGRMGAVASCLYQRHSNVGSELHI